MLSTLFPPDPTLIVDNVSRVMEKIEPKLKMQVWNDVLEHGWIQAVNKKEFSFKEEECADIYVNCCHPASWDTLARSLYRHHQVAAVEEVRSYLPPRGQPHYSVLITLQRFIYGAHILYRIICTHTSLIILAY